MVVLKKLILAPFFLITFALLINELNPLFKSYDFIFSLTLESLYQFLFLSSLILLSSLIFTIFASFANDGKFVYPVIILTSLTPFLFIPLYLGIILMVGIGVSLILIYLTLENTLKIYTTFNSSSLFGPSIRNLSFMLIICFSITYYLSVNTNIAQKGFQIPDSLIESALNFIPKNQIPQESVAPQPQLQISKEQIEQLQQNPQLLEQYGLDPKILDNLDQSQNTSTSVSEVTDEFLKLALKDQLDKIIKPYINFLPISLAFLFFITFQAITSFLYILIYPLLWIIFYLLEKSGFIQFTTEMRPVRKMVV